MGFALQVLQVLEAKMQPVILSRAQVLKGNEGVDTYTIF